MNYIQSEDKFQCTLCEVCSNTDEYIKKHFDEKHESDEVYDDDENKSEEEWKDEDIEGVIDRFYRKRVNLPTMLLRS